MPKQATWSPEVGGRYLLIKVFEDKPLHSMGETVEIMSFPVDEPGAEEFYVTEISPDGEWVELRAAGYVGTYKTWVRPSDMLLLCELLPLKSAVCDQSS